MYAAGEQDTLTLQWSTSETALELICGVACSWSFDQTCFLCQSNFDKQELSGYAGKLSLSTVNRNGILPGSAGRMANHHIGTWLCVHLFLDHHFPKWWTFSAGPISWPARSPDITPCNSFLWGCVKDCTYQTPVADINDLKNRIQAAMAKVKIDTLPCAWMELEYCLDIVRLTGAHVECV